MTVAPCIEQQENYMNTKALEGMRSLVLKLGETVSNFGVQAFEDVRLKIQALTHTQNAEVRAPRSHSYTPARPHARPGYARVCNSH